jgi:hypothetical protein
MYTSHNLFAFQRPDIRHVEDIARDQSKAIIQSGRGLCWQCIVDLA